MRKRRAHTHFVPINSSRDGDRPLTLTRLVSDLHGEYVYFIRVGATVKIGHTGILAQRLYAYGSAPFERLLHVESGTLADEQALHRRFAPFRAHGHEYYAPVPHLLRYIDDRRQALYGLPALDWSRVA